MMVNDGKSYTGWWLTYLSEKYEFVSWDGEIPNIWNNKTCSISPTRNWQYAQNCFDLARNGSKIF